MDDRAHHLRVDSISANGMWALALKPISTGCILPFELEMPHLPGGESLWLVGSVSRVIEGQGAHRLGFKLIDGCQADIRRLRAFCQSN